jgi:hypothetical protein
MLPTIVILPIDAPKYKEYKCMECGSLRFTLEIGDMYICERCYYGLTREEDLQDVIYIWNGQVTN